MLTLVSPSTADSSDSSVMTWTVIRHCSCLLPGNTCPPPSYRWTVMTNIATAAAPGRAAVVLISNSEIDCSIIYLLSLHVCCVAAASRRTDIASVVLYNSNS